MFSCSIMKKVTASISDGVSRLGLGLETSLETHFCESRSRSRRFQVSRLRILQRNGLLKFLLFNDFCLLYLQEKTTITRRKNARNLKKIQVRSDDDIFSKNLAKCTKFEVSSLGLELQVSSLSLGLRVFGEVSVSSLNFNEVLVSVSKVMVSTISLASMYGTSLKYSAVSSVLTSQCSQLCAVYLF